MTKTDILRLLIGKRTQKEFAKIHGKGENQVSQWLLEKKNISYSTLQEIAKAEGYLLTIEFELEKL